MAPCLIRPRRSEHEGCAVVLPKTWDDRFSLTTSHLYSTERQLRVDCGSWCSVRTFELLPTMRFRVLPGAVYCGSVLSDRMESKRRYSGSNNPFVLAFTVRDPGHADAREAAHTQLIVKTLQPFLLLVRAPAPAVATNHVGGTKRPLPGSKYEHFSMSKHCQSMSNIGLAVASTSFSTSSALETSTSGNSNSGRSACLSP